jgi:hypothetical protein
MTPDDDTPPRRPPVDDPDAPHAKPFPGDRWIISRQAGRIHASHPRGVEVEMTPESKISVDGKTYRAGDLDDERLADLLDKELIRTPPAFNPMAVAFDLEDSRNAD